MKKFTKYSLLIAVKSIFQINDSVNQYTRKYIINLYFINNALTESKYDNFLS